MEFLPSALTIGPQCIVTSSVGSNCVFNYAKQLPSPDFILSSVSVLSVATIIPHLTTELLLVSRCFLAKQFGLDFA